MAKVEIISSCVVRMAENGISATPISSLDLTPCDKRLLQLSYLQRGLILHNPNKNNITLHSQQILESLKNSLSLSLHFFPPLAGRLNACYSSVICNNAGVEFTHAAAAAVSVSDILEPKYTPEILYSCFPLNGFRNHQGISTPLLAVQLTVLADGLFLACAANHAVVDGTSFWHFINSWSEISRGLDTISKIPIFDRCSPAANNPTFETQNAAVKPPESVPVVNRIFHFSRECLTRLKSKASSEASTDKISTLQSLSAHLWRCITRCRRGRLEGEEEATFLILVGARGRNPIFPDGYFGNAICCADTTMSEAELLQEGLGNAALKINELISRKAKEAAAAEIMEVDWKNPASVRSPFAVGGSARHDVYGNDFGWGKPISVRGGKGRQLDGMVCIFPAADGGIDVELCLEEETSRAMEEDAEFTQAFDF